MVAPTHGLLKMPKGKGFMSANMVLPLHDVLGRTFGPASRDRIYRNAGLRYLPGPEEPVRERQVQDVFLAVRNEFPEDSRAVFESAGKQAGTILAEYRIPKSAKTALQRMPWPIATWMLVQSARMNAWTFGGSAQMTALTTARFELLGNPTLRPTGEETPVCHFHRSLFQTLFQTLVHPRMICTEVQCEACHDPSCVFELSVPPGDGLAGLPG